jgi:signal transduction histidine kinase
MNAARLLVIEDEADIRENLSWLLEAAGYDVVTAEDGEQGVARALSQPPDLVLCDVTMPRLDGFGVLRRLRTHPATEQTPFLFLSARSAPVDVRSGMALGADDYLAKPFASGDLLRAIQTRLDRRRTEQARAADRMDELRVSIARSLPHELRTPLSGIIGLSEAMLDAWDDLPRPEALSLVRDIHESGVRLERTVQSYGLYAWLMLERSRPGRALPAPLDRPGQCAAEAAQATARELGAADRLRIEIESEAPVRISPDLLGRAVAEVVRNACDFSLAHQPVSLRVTTDERQVRIEVRDRGLGLRPGELARVGAFVQFGREQREQQGSGLGLAIAQQIAELHGGSLSLHVREKSGLRVALRLPLS